jgi:hypothetical protein
MVGRCGRDDARGVAPWGEELSDDGGREVPGCASQHGPCLGEDRARDAPCRRLDDAGPGLRVAPVVGDKTGDEHRYSATRSVMVGE